jgi:DNA polymerase-1
MIASYLIDASRSSHAMDALALDLLRHTNIPISDLIGSGKSQRTFDTVPLARATEYAAEDADVTLRLSRAMTPQIRAMGLTDLYARVEVPLVEVLSELEFNGVLVDREELERQRERLEREIVRLKGQIDDEAYATLGRTFDPDSPKQLGIALFNRPSDAEPGLGLSPIKKTKTGNSTDAEVLEKLTQDAGITTRIPERILEYRQLTKLVSTYLVALRDEIDPATGRIHASFNQTVAVTGRLSSSDPNLQNIPIRTEIGREIRRAFVAPPGFVLVSADYSQIELRLLAHLSRDPALIAAFEAGADIHTAVAAQIHGVPESQVTREQRSGAKMVNFGIVYGVTPFGLARRLGVPNDHAAEIINGYKKRFAGITTFLQECVEQARRLGYVETMLGRRRPIPEIDSNQPSRRALAERTAINSVVQGSAADLIKLAMVDLHARIKHTAGEPTDLPRPADLDAAQASALRGLRMLLQIHDELVFEAPAGSAEAAKAVIVDCMQRAMTLRVPLVADAGIGRDWFDCK